MTCNKDSCNQTETLEQQQQPAAGTVHDAMMLKMQVIHTQPSPALATQPPSLQLLLWLIIVLNCHFPYNLNTAHNKQYRGFNYILHGDHRFRYLQHSESKPISGHSVPLAGLGGFILIFGFLAFNGGSQVRGGIIIRADNESL